MRKILTILLLLAATTGRAQEYKPSMQASDTDRNLIQAALQGWHVSIGAGFNVGGVSPLPLPKEIRKINAFNPTLLFYLEGRAHKSFENSRFGLEVGLRLETKGMKTRARTKNYNMSISMQDRNDAGELVMQSLSGLWTGRVQTKVDNKYLTIPLLATYTFKNQRWRVALGPYMSILLDREFSGYVYEGYLRKDTPVGEKIVFSDGATATYDFSHDLRHVDWGIQAGGTFRAYRHFSVDVRLNWGLSDAFKSSFKTITFPMYTIYGAAGISYEF